MEFLQKDNVSTLTLGSSLTAKNIEELAYFLELIGRQHAHSIVLNMHATSYVTAKGLDALFQHYLPLYRKKFLLEIHEANEAVAALLGLANFHVISCINPHKDTQASNQPVSLSQE